MELFPRFSGVRTKILFMAVLSVVLFAAYSNSFHAAWHYDDFDNIIENRNIQLKSLDLEGFHQSFIFRGTFSRPLSYLTFALNYYAGGTEVFGYHVVNFIIHLLTACFLFSLIYGTLNLPAVKARFDTPVLPVAMIATLFWAMNPLHVPAVTIIVQRMASMAGLFYVMAMVFYLHARTAEFKWKKRGNFILCLIAMFCAFGTKENTAVLPLSLFLYETLLITPLSGDQWIRLAKWSCLPLCLLGVGIFFLINQMGFLDGYQFRYFSLTERLLTEPRIFFQYLSLLFYPLTGRLTLLHDVPVSQGLFTPWTTFFSIFGLILYVGGSLWMIRRWPLYAFCTLFFLINHLIEGTFIPLELIFEHRNYIPSMFVFVPIALLAVRLWTHYISKTSIRILFISAGALLLLFQVHVVFQRNAILQQDLTLWLDNTMKYPRLSQPHVQLAKNFDRLGDRRHAFIALSKAYELNRYSNKFQKAEVEFDLGQIWNSVDRHEAAMVYYHKARTAWPTYTAPLVGMAMIHWKENNLNGALSLIQTALQEKPHDAYFHALAGTLLLQRRQFDKAEEEARLSLNLDPAGIEPVMIQAQCARFQGHERDSIQLWLKVLDKDSRNLSAHLALLELYASEGDRRSVITMAGRILKDEKGKTPEDIIQRAVMESRLSAYQPNVIELRKAFREISVHDN